MEVLGQDRREGLGRRASSRALLAPLTIVSTLLLLSSLYSAEASVFRKARESVLDAAAPILALFARPIAYVQDVVGDVGDYFKVIEQNKALRAENAELRQWMDEALALRKTLAQYEKLKAFQAPPDATPVNAFVIGDSNDAYNHAMLVNAGVGDGVRRDQAVVDDRGLVGRIVEAGRAASRILLLTDARSRVPVFVEDANLEGILVGRANSRPTISFTQGAAPTEFASGQRVLTSGAGGVVPRGLPVGVIVDVGGGEPIVDLYADYARARLVRIINYEFPDLEPAQEGEAVPPHGPPAAPARTQAAPTPAVAITSPPAPAPVEGEQGADEPQQALDDGTAPAVAAPAEPEGD
jgi:rod shape-determining protein MreC